MDERSAGQRGCAKKVESFWVTATIADLTDKQGRRSERFDTNRMFCVTSGMICASCGTLHFLLCLISTRSCFHPV